MKWFAQVPSLSLRSSQFMRGKWRLSCQYACLHGWKYLGTEDESLCVLRTNHRKAAMYPIRYSNIK